MQNETITVLLADDDADDRAFFRDALKEIKIKTNVEIVNDGLELRQCGQKWLVKSRSKLY